MARQNYRELLRTKREQKFDLLKDSQINSYECNYSDVGKCIACHHPTWCIFSEERIKYEEKLALLKNKEKDLKSYLLNGAGTYGYDKEKLKVELLKVKKEVRKLNEDYNR